MNGLATVNTSGGADKMADHAHEPTVVSRLLIDKHGAIAEGASGIMRLSSQGGPGGNPMIAKKYVKVTFFRGASLKPLPPGQSMQAEVRYLDLHEQDPLNEAQLSDWIAQASRLPGCGAKP